MNIRSKLLCASALGIVAFSPLAAQTSAAPATTAPAPVAAPDPAASTTPAAAPEPAAAARPAPAPAGSNSGETSGVQEIVVTAQKRSENVQQVPIAISAFTASALKERSITNVADLSNLAPNVTLTAGSPFSGSSSVLSAYIRGIGSNDFAFNIDPGVGIYLDGVYLARSIGANQDLPDVERIEVLKGPQGTLFGRNTIGGALSIVTHDPGKEFKLTSDVTTGSYNLIQIKATADIPITKDLSSSISYSSKNRNGYMHRIAYPGATATSDSANNFVAAGYDGQGLGTEGGDNTYSLRGKLKWDDGGKLRATASADYSYTNQSQAPSTLLTTVTTTDPANGVVGNFAGTSAANIPGTAFDPSGTTGYNFAGLYNFCVTSTATQIAARNATALCGPRSGVNGYKTQPGLAGSGQPTYDNKYVTGNIDTSYANGVSFSRTKSAGGQVTLDYEFSPDLSAKSITSYRELHWSSGSDLDGSPISFFTTSFSENQWQFSQEFQLVGTALDKKLRYVLGAYYFKEAGDIHDYVTFGDGLLQIDGPNILATRNVAGFGQFDYRASDVIGITVGGRYTHEYKTFQGYQSDLNGFNYGLFNCPVLDPVTGLPAEVCRTGVGFPVAGEPLRYYPVVKDPQIFNNFSPKLGLQIHPSRDVMIYGSYSQGYKTGGWTTRLTAPVSTAPSFGPEKAKTFEFGFKSKLIDRKLQLNGAAFHTDYEGIQLNSQKGVSPTIQNTGNARINGAEIELVMVPTPALQVTASAGYTDAKYTYVCGENGVFRDFCLGNNAYVAPTSWQTGVYAGGTLPATPKFKFNISPRYQMNLENGGRIVLIADYAHSSSAKNDTEGTYLLIRPALATVNGSIAYREPGKRWNITVGGTNIFNTRYVTNGQANLTAGSIFGTYSRPAEWFAKFGVNF